MKIAASHHQERLWFIDNFERKTIYENGTVYHNIPLILKCKFKINLEIAKKAINKIIADNEIFRTEIVEENGALYQKINESENYSEINIIESKNNEEIKEFLLELNEHSFDNGLFSPYMKVYFVTTDQNEQYILFSMHHFICDYYSKELVKNQFILNYNSYANNIEPENNPRLQYADFSEWQRNMDKNLEEDQLLYWRRKAGHQLQALELPIDVSRKLIHEYKAAEITEKIDKQMLENIEEVSKKLGCTKEIYFLTVFKLLMVKMTGLSEINIGTSCVNRKDEELVNVAGPIANLLLLSNQYDLECDFKTFLEETKNAFEQAMENSDVPFDKLVTYLNPVKDMSRTALFDILFVYDDKCIDDNEEFFEIDNNYGWGKYDYNLRIKDNGEYGCFYLTYNELYYKKSTANRLLHCFVKLLNEVIDNQDKAIMKYNCIPNFEKEKILNTFCITNEMDYSKLTITNAIHIQYEKKPDKIAVTDGIKEYTYKEIEEKSNNFAEFLKNSGISNQKVVAIAIDKCSEFVVLALGTLKAGCIYLPIDRNFPKERIDYMLEDSNASCVICETEDVDLYNAKNTYTLKEIFEKISSFPSTPVDSNRVENIAYIIYTSGTTGKPKGMMIENHNVTSLIFNNLSLFDFTSNDVWSCTHNFNFDFSVWEMYGSLFTGGKLVIIPKNECNDICSLRKKLSDFNVTILSQTPLAFFALTEYEKAFKEHDLSIRKIIYGGEELEVEKLMPWKMMYNNTSFINMYGITETTVHVTFKNVTDYEIKNNLNSIGKPLNGYQVYVVDKGDCMCPIGVAGEMLVGGTGVGFGYLNNPKLTNIKFIQNIYGSGKLYRSGDYAFWDENGELHYVGRMDTQIKVRGFRIELGDIETQIRRIPFINDAVVIAKKDDSGTNNIYAYLVSNQSVSINDVKKELHKNLPNYMIPAYFAQIDKIPLTLNGKLDKSALPDVQNRGEVEFASPSNEIEAILVKIFKEILKEDKISVYDNFFNLGGDSIKAMKLVAKLRKYGYELLIKDLMQAVTIKDIGEAVTINKDVLRYYQDEITGEVPLSAIQKDFFKKHYTNEKYFYQSVVLRYNGIIDKKAVQFAAEKLQRHHDMLRAVYKSDKQIVQSIQECPKINCHEINFDDYDSNDTKNEIKKYCENLLNETDLENGPLFKCAIFHTNKYDYLFLGIHHLVVDGLSWNILIEDFCYMYEQYLENEEIFLQPKTAYYGEWVSKIEEEYTGDFLNDEISYWENIYEELPEINLPLLNPQTEKRYNKKLVLESDETEKIIYYTSEKFDVKVQDIILAAIVKALHSLFDLSSVSVDIELTGRNGFNDDISLVRSVGWFTEIFPANINYIKDIKELFIEIDAACKDNGHGIGHNILNARGLLDNNKKSMVCFNYLGDYDYYLEDQKLWDFVTDIDICDIANENEMSNLIIADSYISNGKLNINLTFNSEYINEKTANDIKEELKNVIFNIIGEAENYDDEIDNNSNQISDEMLDEIMSFLD